MPEGWKYYNHALIPKSEPHEEPNLSELKGVWSKGALFARYTTEFDCGNDTGWWYCLKDEPIKIEEMKADKRYKVNKGLRYFDIRKISSVEYGDQLYECFQKAACRYESYKVKYTKEQFVELAKKDDCEYWGAFLKSSGKLVAYSRNKVYRTWVDFSVIKFDPEYMKFQVSAAMIYAMTVEYINIQKKKYVCDGERCISHKTNIQEYLEDMFGFRKAYCRLHIKYRPSVLLIVKVLYPFRNLLSMLDNIKLFRDINSVLKMEEIVRKQKKEDRNG